MRSPFIRSMGGTPTARCTSEQPCCMPSFRNASMRATDLESSEVTQGVSPKHATVRRGASVTQCAVQGEPGGGIPHFPAPRVGLAVFLQRGAQVVHGLV